MAARQISGSRSRALLAVLLSAVLVALAAPFAGVSAAASPSQISTAAADPAETASGFLFYKFPTVQPACTGFGLNVSANPHYSRDDCGFTNFKVSGTPTSVKGQFFAEGATEPFLTKDAINRGNGVWRVSFSPDADWPAGVIRLVVLADGAPAGEATFGHNLLGATIQSAPGRYQPGDDIPVTGEIYELDTDPAGSSTADGVPAEFSLRLIKPNGGLVPVQRLTAGENGSFSYTIPGDQTSDIKIGPDTDYQVTVGIAASDATYQDPDSGQWAAKEAGLGSVVLQSPPDGLLLENSFVSAVGWVKPGETYPSRVFVRNLTGKTFDNVDVTVTAAPGSSFTQASAGADAGTASVATPTTITWNVGTVPAADANGPAVRTLVIESKADTVVDDPKIVWKDLSSSATLTVGGVTSGNPELSHGPKVIPPSTVYDTARYGDRPFPVVPVDYRDRKHQKTNSGDELAGKINSKSVEGSTFNLFQEMSLGQLFPQGTIPSSGIASKGFGDKQYDFTEPEPQGTCKGTTLPREFAGSPLLPERIDDGFYQLPGDTEYYGGDKFGSAVVGSQVPGPLFDIDSACGPTGKLVYDSASIADPEIDYSDYDTDKDGVVDFFMVVYAGCGGNGASQLSTLGCPYDTVPYDNVWPHSSSLEFYYTDEETGLTGYISDDQLKNLKGEKLYYTDASRSQMTTNDTGIPVFVRVGPYNVNPETAIDNASVISHEYGHSLGLPDFYSLGNRETYGDWNLMATDKSQNMDVFSRQEMGWIVPEVLEPGASRTVENWSDSKEDTHTITWQTPAGDPYTLSGPRVHNAESYVAKLPGRQLIDPAKFDTGDKASKTHAWWSGSGNDFGCAPEKGHNLDVVIPGLGDYDPATTKVTLEFKSLWDIEWDYDYGFVLTSNNGGEEYISHKSENGYTTDREQNPNGNSCQLKYGNGITGSSGSYAANTERVDRVVGDYPSSVFLADKYDISDLAGVDNGVLRFSYSTDPGLARPGWYIDDIKVTVTEEGQQPEVVLNTDLEDDSEGGPDSPNFYNGGCKDDSSTAKQCTSGWNYIASDAEAPADHAYYLEMRDRSGFDETGKGENDRDPIAFAPGLSMVYTDEAHGYGNVGTDNPPAQSPLDSQPQPGNDTPNLSDAAWTAAAEDNLFSDFGDGHVDNYSNPEEQKAAGDVAHPWRFAYNCLTFEVLRMQGDGVGPSVSNGDLTGDVKFTMGAGCGKFDYGYVADGGGGGGTDPPGNAAPVAKATVTPKAALKSRQFTFDASGTTDAESPNELDYSWRFGDESGTEKTAGQVTKHKYARAGIYTATVTVTDPRGASDTDSVKVYVNKRVQCSKPSVTRTGGWRSRANGSAQKNHYCVNDRDRQTGGDSMGFTFTGPRLDIGYGKGKTGRSATVFIDGFERGKISFHNRSDKPQFGFERNYRNLGAGKHTVELVVLPPRENRRYAFMDSFTFAGKALRQR